MVSIDELKDDEEFADLKEDVEEECKRFGQVVALEIPRPKARPFSLPKRWLFGSRLLFSVRVVRTEKRLQGSAISLSSLKRRTKLLRR
jgi:hypothetical protein